MKFSDNVTGPRLSPNDFHKPREIFHIKQGGRGGSHFFAATNYNLAATLTSGQAFRWRPTTDNAWDGIIGQHHLILRHHPNGIEAQTAAPNPDWSAIQHYLQT